MDLQSSRRSSTLLGEHILKDLLGDGTLQLIRSNSRTECLIPS
ncbi:hypothetical protein Hanom_Chr16g01459591 [Helianthus anomalus]